jgi:hypothetical protein
VGEAAPCAAQLELLALQRRLPPALLALVQVGG